MGESRALQSCAEEMVDLGRYSDFRRRRSGYIGSRGPAGLSAICSSCSGWLTWRSTSLPSVAGRCAIKPRSAGQLHVRAKMYLRNFIATLIIQFLSVAASAQIKSPEQLVVIESAAGATNVSGQPSAPFLPSMVVSVVQHGKSTALIKRLYDSERIGWLSLRSVAKPASFKPIGAWHGPSKFVVYSESGDSQRTYYLHANGTYRSIESSGYATRVKTGKLFRLGQVIWAKPIRNKVGELDPWGFLWLQPDGKLCHLSDAGICIAG